jgi:hypothetical protein
MIILIVLHLDLVADARSMSGLDGVLSLDHFGSEKTAVSRVSP